MSISSVVIWIVSTSAFGHSCAVLVIRCEFMTALMKINLIYLTTYGTRLKA